MVAVALLGFASLAIGTRFLYISYYDQPQLRYIPTDDVWREHLTAVVAAAQQPQAEQATASAYFTVAVAGAVKSPGVYQVSAASRVQDALLQAGGFHANADVEYIHRELNLAARLHDQDKIYIPRTGESLLKEQSTPKGSQDVTAAALMGIEGIGEKRAEAILAGMPYKNKADFLARSAVPDAIAEIVWGEFDALLSNNNYQ